MLQIGCQTSWLWSARLLHVKLDCRIVFCEGNTLENIALWGISLRKPQKQSSLEITDHYFGHTGISATDIWTKTPKKMFVFWNWVLEFLKTRGKIAVGMMIWCPFLVILVKIPLVNHSCSSCPVQIPVESSRFWSKKLLFFKLVSKKGPVLSFAKGILDLKSFKTLILGIFADFDGLEFQFSISRYPSQGNPWCQIIEADTLKTVETLQKFGGWKISIRYS